MSRSATSTVKSNDGAAVNRRPPPRPARVTPAAAATAASDPARATPPMPQARPSSSLVEQPSSSSVVRSPAARTDPSRSHSPHPYGTSGRDNGHNSTQASSAAPSHISPRDSSWENSRDSLAPHPYDAVPGAVPASSPPLPQVRSPAHGADPAPDRRDEVREVPPSTVAASESPSTFPASTASLAATALTTTTRNQGSLFRQVYNDKLRNSVQSIIHALTVELPADHIFAQLLADPTTMTYCKVRLAEVVETFLYATQAQQFHNLVAEMARQHEELILTQQELATVRQALEECVRENGRASVDGRGASSIAPPSACHTPVRRPDSPNVSTANPAVTETAAPAGNPMNDDAARQALLSLLEEATRDHELERSRQCLAGPERLVQIATTQPSLFSSSSAVSAATADRRGSRESTREDALDAVSEKFDYVSSVMTELYRSVNGLLYYVDGSLESLDALRNDLEKHQSSTMTDGPRDAWLVDTPMSTAQSEFTTPSANLGPRRSPVSHERQHVRALLNQLREAQVHSARALDRLTQDTEQLARRESAAVRALEVAQRELKVATTAAEGAQQLQGSLERLRTEYQRASAAEREDAHSQIDELRTRLEAAQAEVRTLQPHANAYEAQARELAAARDERDKAIARAEAAEAALATRQLSESDLQAVVRGLQKEGVALRRELDSCEGELVCAQVELHVTQMESYYWECEVTKHETMERLGYARLMRDHAALVQLHAEAVRHQQVQTQIAETSALQKDMATQQVQAELTSLLRTVWNDEDREVEEDVKEDVTGRRRGQIVQDRHRMPSTLAGLVTALTYAYSNVRTHHPLHAQRIAELEKQLHDKATQEAALTASRADLQRELDVARGEVKELRSELDLLSTNNPMKALLARQEALLTSVSEERAVMRDRWGNLNADYIALERRNAELHARCVGKEHENAKLNGLIKSMNASPTKQLNVSQVGISEMTPERPSTTTDAARPHPQPRATPAAVSVSTRAPRATESVRTAVSTPATGTTAAHTPQSIATTPSAPARSTTAPSTGARLLGSPATTPTTERPRVLPRESSASRPGSGSGGISR